jgi:hypothetical protein
MHTIEARFQYFYCTSSPELPHPDVPTRDVTNTRGAGYKTEPYLEERTENWCKCRARFITPAVKRAISSIAEGGNHYLLLTTRHPRDWKPFIVGLMPFSLSAFERLRGRFPNRWSQNTYLPYVSDNRLKLASFQDAFLLTDWMRGEKVDTIPGGQGGRMVVPKDLLQRVVDHFSSIPNHTKAFLENVTKLEKELRQTNPQQWHHYQNSLRGGRRRPPSARKKC